MDHPDAKSRRGNAFCRPGQAKRDPGPITTGRCCYAKAKPRVVVQPGPVVMGPCSVRNCAPGRGDTEWLFDIQIRDTPPRPPSAGGLAVADRIAIRSAPRSTGSGAR